MQYTRHITTRREVRERLVRLINEIAQIPVECITDVATVDGELRMESVTFVELHVAIEDEFQIEIDPLEVVELNEFGAIVDYVCRSIASGVESHASLPARVASAAWKGQ